MTLIIIKTQKASENSLRYRNGHSLTLCGIFLTQSKQPDKKMIPPFIVFIVNGKILLAASSMNNTTSAVYIYFIF